jgi:hypothetical protein
MKKFKSVIIVKQPKALVWKAMRDRLPETVPFLDNVAAITQTHREEPTDGFVRLINLWKADVKIPGAIQSIVDPSNLSWLDRAEWFEASNKCQWRIEPQFFTDHIRCAGNTYFEPALGGRGTRITFEGELEIAVGNIGGLPAFMQGPVSKAMEALVISLVPQNFRKITDALSLLLEQKTDVKSSGQEGNRQRSSRWNKKQP